MEGIFGIIGSSEVLVPVGGFETEGKRNNFQSIFFLFALYVVYWLFFLETDTRNDH